MYKKQKNNNNSSINKKWVFGQIGEGRGKLGKECHVKHILHTKMCNHKLQLYTSLFLD